MGLYQDCCDVKCRNLGIGGNPYCSGYSAYREGDEYYSTFLSYWRGDRDASSCPRFEKQSEGCFLTSAMVEYYGKPDNCDELMTLRLFRDQVLKKTTKGRKLIVEYYLTAPEIVKAINQSNFKEEHYSYIHKVVDNCVEAIKEGKNDNAIKLYYNMLNKFRDEFDL